MFAPATDKPRRKRRRKLPEGAVWAYFYNEVPTFGCGWRIVVPVVRGKKVSLLEVATGARRRIPLKVWAPIAKKLKEVTVTNK